MSSDTNTGGV